MEHHNPAAKSPSSLFPAFCVQFQRSGIRSYQTKEKIIGNQAAYQQNKQHKQGVTKEFLLNLSICLKTQNIPLLFKQLNRSTI